MTPLLTEFENLSCVGPATDYIKVMTEWNKIICRTTSANNFAIKIASHTFGYKKVGKEKAAYINKKKQKQKKEREWRQHVNLRDIRRRCTVHQLAGIATHAVFSPLFWINTCSFVILLEVLERVCCWLTPLRLSGPCSSTTHHTNGCECTNQIQ